VETQAGTIAIHEGDIQVLRADFAARVRASERQLLEEKTKLEVGGARLGCLQLLRGGPWVGGRQ
jgi:hypothetical protein